MNDELEKFRQEIEAARDEGGGVSSLLQDVVPHYLGEPERRIYEMWKKGEIDPGIFSEVRKSIFLKYEEAYGRHPDVPEYHSIKNFWQWLGAHVTEKHL